MTIVAVELCLIAFDYLLFLFGPLIGQILREFNIKKADENYDWPIATDDSDDHEHDKANISKPPGKLAAFFGRWFKLSLMDKFDREICKFNELRERRLNANQEERTALLKRADSLIKIRWPWISSYPTLIDPVDKQLNCWSHDLCLIADWDFPWLLPKLCANSAGVAGSPDPLYNDKNIGPNNSNNNNNSNDNINLTENDVTSSQEGVDRHGMADQTLDESQMMKIIYSSPLERKFLLQVEAEKLAHTSMRARRLSAATAAAIWRPQAPTSSSGPQKSSSILCVKWCTKEEFDRDLERSSLAFYYTQIHSELVPLHSLLAELLDCACLLESASLKQIDRCSPHDDSCANSTTAQPHAGGLLTRYALLLMLVAYLSGEEETDKSSEPFDDHEDDDGGEEEDAAAAECAERRRSKGGKHLLSAKLIGFLSTYSRLAADSSTALSIGPKAGSRTRELKLDLVEASGSSRKLSILDPSGGGGGGAGSPPTTSARLITSTEPTADPKGADLSGGVGEMAPGVAEQIGTLFALLSQHISAAAAAAESDSSSGNSAVLRSLFRLALDFGRQRGHETETSDGLKRKSNEDSEIAAQLKRLSSGGAKDEDQQQQQPDGCAALNSISKASPNRLALLKSSTVWDPSILRGFWAQLRWRKLLTNALYLMLLLLVRNSMLNYLENLRDDLQAEAKEDLRELKNIIFDTSSSARNHHQWQRRVTRDSNEFATSDFVERQRREREDPILGEEPNDDGSPPRDAHGLADQPDGAGANHGERQAGGMEFMMEAMMQQMFADLEALGGAGEGAEGGGPADPELQELMNLLRGGQSGALAADGDGQGDESDLDDEKMDKLKKLLENLAAKSGNDGQGGFDGDIMSQFANMGDEGDEADDDEDEDQDHEDQDGHDSDNDDDSEEGRKVEKDHDEQSASEEADDQKIASKATIKDEL